MRENDAGNGQAANLAQDALSLQEWGKPAQALKAGDVVNIPAGVLAG